MCDLSKDEQAQVRIISADLWWLAMRLIKSTPMNEDWIKCQIAELERLLEMCKDSEIMRLSLTARIEDFKEQLTHFNP